MEAVPPFSKMVQRACPCRDLPLLLWSGSTSLLLPPWVEFKTLLLSGRIRRSFPNWSAEWWTWQCTRFWGPLCQGGSKTVTQNLSHI
jgi:hypothetical protein